MPNVGGKKFPYTRAGQKAARRHGRATGQPVGGGGNRGQGNKMNSYAPTPGRPGRVPGKRFGAKPGSLPPVPGRGAAPRKRGLPVGPGGNRPRPLPRRGGGPGVAPPRGGIRGGNPSGRRGGSRVMRNQGMAPKKRGY